MNRDCARWHFAGGRFSFAPDFLWSRTMTDSEILTLVDRLERCVLAKGEFHHRDHLTVAVVYLYGAGFDAAAERMRASLKRFAAHHSVIGLYHETITQFWLRQVEMRLDRRLCLVESVRRIQEQLDKKDLCSEYYSPERIQSQEARESWVQPDRKPFAVAER
jgi:hypothetical protein